MRGKAGTESSTPTSARITPAYAGKSISRRSTTTRTWDHPRVCGEKYKVYVYNTVDKFWDCYEVLAEDPVDARNVAVQRLIDETGHGLDVYEVTDVCEIKG